MGHAPFRLKVALKVTHPSNNADRQISAYDVSTIRDNEKIQLRRIGSRPRAFQRAMDGVRTYATLPQIPPPKKKVAQKAIFLFLKNKIQFQSNKVCYTVSLCENFQQRSCSITIPPSNGP